MEMNFFFHYFRVLQDYYKALEDADEKVQLANQIYDLVSITVLLQNSMCLMKTMSHCVLSVKSTLDGSVRLKDESCSKIWWAEHLNKTSDDIYLIFEGGLHVLINVLQWNTLTDKVYRANRCRAVCIFIHLHEEIMFPTKQMQIFELCRRVLFVLVFRSTVTCGNWTRN